MENSSLLPRLDAATNDITAELNRLREKLSPRGDMVSEAGKKKTQQVFGEPLAPQQVVERICRDVKERGLDAVLEYSQKLDAAEMTADQLRVPAEELRAAHAAAAPEFLQTVRQIRDNVARFQEAILHRDVAVIPSSGVSLRQRYVPLRRVGICVPGGAAAYPSTVLMTVVPARAAGVDEIVVVAPPTANGANNPDVLAVCHELGVDEVYRVGGAQAVAALAYGVDRLAKVDKIVGPGNLFVALAKKLVFGEVDIDSIAGPSEVVVIADKTTEPHFAAADLLAQAEHAPGSCVLISWDVDVLNAIEACLVEQLAKLERADLTLPSLRDYSASILVTDEAEACRVTDLIAPEHLHLAIDDAQRLAPSIRNAGATFLGRFTPVALGDYIAGPSHVLPTGGTATWAAGLSSNDFLRSGSVIEYSEEALRDVAVHVARIADKEGLGAHRESIEIRVNPT
ncbi:MAG TPA: histidinol dehydrogenase [Planctomycetes bacterium]|nr:histidinol dehydrogenase [Planctomycetota bacterium]